MTELESAFRKIQGDIEIERGRRFILELAISVILQQNESKTSRARVDFVLTKLLENMSEISPDPDDPFIRGMQASVDSIVSRTPAPQQLAGD